jgi:CHAT domain-containing protein
LAALCCTLLFACGKPFSPESALEHVREQMRTGHLDLAQRDVDSGLARVQKSDPDWAPRFRVVKARILMMRGSYADSLALLKDPLPPSLARTDTEVERAMVQSLDFDFLQQYPDAEEAISRAESLANSINSPLLGAVEQTRGIVEDDRNNLDAAITAFRNASAFGRSHHLPRIELDSLGNLGFIAMQQEHYDEAAELFRSALETSRSIGAADVEAKTLGNLGWTSWVVGDFEGAEDYLRKAHDKAAQLGLTEDETYWLISVADVEAMQHRFDQADTTGRQALALAEKHDDKKTLSACLNVLSRIAILTDHLDSAAAFNSREQALAEAAHDPLGITHAQFIAARIALSRHDYQSAVATFQKVLADPQAETYLKWESHLRLGELYSEQQRPAEAEREFRTALDTVESAQTSIQDDHFRLSFLSSAIELYQAYVNFLIDQHRQLEALAIADLTRSRSLAQSLSAKPGSSSDRNHLPNLQATARRLNATLLYYWVGWDRSWVWVITGRETSLLPVPPGRDLEPLVKSYLASFTGQRDPLESPDSGGAKLYSELVRPAEKILPKNGRVFILPDGALNTLNFETLVVPSPQPHYWIEDATLLTANSLSRLSASSPSAPPNAGKLLLMGDAVAASPEFPPLPQAGREVGLLEKYFDSAHRLEFTGKAATPSAFLQNSPEKFSYLHFASHGTASSLRPLESAVILSPEGGSYKLYARDVVKHPLNAYLVTISACNGTGVKTFAGEGLVGLSWAFLRAGAHNVIAGLWEVSNASTPQLMDELYKGLHSGQDPATALRNAKLSLLHSSGNYRRPFYWAPFLLYSGS